MSNWPLDFHLNMNPFYFILKIRNLHCRLGFLLSRHENCYCQNEFEAVFKSEFHQFALTSHLHSKTLTNTQTPQPVCSQGRMQLCHSDTSDCNVFIREEDGITSTSPITSFSSESMPLIMFVSVCVFCYFFQYMSPSGFTVPSQTSPHHVVSSSSVICTQRGYPIVIAPVDIAITVSF